MTGKRILVTGGAGFLGSHLCAHLLRTGCEVVCLDNFSTGSEQNLTSLKSDRKFQIVRHDVIDPIRIEADQIYNLACPASPVHYQLNPIATIEANVLGARNMLRLAALTGARILQASTSEVYGDPQMHPQVESYWGHVNPIGPRSCYDEGKRLAETLMMDYHRQQGVAVRIVRIFNTYGPGMAVDDGRVVSNLILQALRNEPLTLFGAGSQTRSFCYVTDLIEGVWKLMNAEGIDGPVNLGNPHEVTIRELAETIISLCGSRSAIVHRPLPHDDPARRRPDITLAMEQLNWRPAVSLTEGLLKTISYFDNLLSSQPMGEHSLAAQGIPEPLARAD